MSRSVIQPMDAAVTAPEALSLLQQRLLMAEEQAESLIKDMGNLGVSREQILQSRERLPIQRRPVSPVKMHYALKEPGGEGLLWRQCDGLVSRVCRMESLLQTLKLTVFRLETERELDPSHSACLKEQLSALQQESEEEQRTSKRELMRLRDQLCQAQLDRDEAQGQVQKLGEALEVTTASKINLSLAVEELKKVKVQMSDKLEQLKNQLSQESAQYFELEKSHCALLQRVEEMEGAVEWERRQALIVQEDCQALRCDGQASRQRLHEEEGRAHRLQEQCEQLKGQAEVKVSLVVELTGELNSARQALKKQQQENTRLLRDIGDLRTAAEQVQTLNSQLERQCSEVRSALRSLTVENSKLQKDHQANTKAERSRVSQHLREQELLLEAARHNIQAERQGALAAKVKLKMELDSLKVDHAQLLQSSTVAQETAVTQQELLECSIERLRGELTAAIKEVEFMRQDRNSEKAEIGMMFTKLQGENSVLETQLAKSKLVAATLQKLEEENRRLMGKLAAMEHQQKAQLQVEHMLKELTDSKNKLAYEKGALQHRVDKLQEELQALSVSEKVQQRKQSSVLENKYTQLRSERSSLKLTCHKLKAQLRKAQGELASAVAARNEALRDSLNLKEQLGQLQKQHRDKLCELEGCLGVSQQGGGSVAQTLENVLASHSRLQHDTETLQQELGGREQELVTLKRDRLLAQKETQRLQAEVEKLTDIMATSHFKKNKMSMQEALDLAQLDNKKLAQSLEQAVLANSTLQANLDRTKDQHQTKSKHRESDLLEARAEIIRLSEHLETMKLQMKKERELAKRSLQREVSELRRALEDSLLRSNDLSRANQELREKMYVLEKVVSNQIARLRDQKTPLQQHLDNKAALSNSQKIKDVEAELKSLETLKDKSLKNKSEESHLIQAETLSVQRKLQSSSQKGELFTERELRCAMQDKCQVHCDSMSQEPAELERWTATMQRWETKRELARIASGYNFGGTRSLTHSH
ncbi:hypothetical protein UPYG_G00202390 [Umbra pygmaea]|uniref:Coiled-coil domain-containing protein 150 n=1 Tax=Umbra pygmaea TaxID=75934 RepID=A0ABD0WJF4_UMBPY